ncbi:MAG: PadR family transcriptional regulator [Gemmatimonas sp.]
METKTLGALELIVLLAVIRLGDDAYGLAVRRDVSDRTQHDYSVGAVYTTLERLEIKGLISSWTAAPTPTRGGRSRRQFKVTASGLLALRDAEQRSHSVWDGVGISSLNPKLA